MTTIRKVRRMARDPQPQGGEGAPDNGNVDGGSAGASADPPEPKAARVTKQSLLINMLGREGGVSLTAIVEATGWQSHTSRAALTGLRKKGHTIERFRSADETTYRIVAAPAAVSVDTAVTADNAGDIAGSRTDATTVIAVDGGVPA